MSRWTPTASSKAQRQGRSPRLPLQLPANRSSLAPATAPQIGLTRNWLLRSVALLLPAAALLLPIGCTTRDAGPTDQQVQKQASAGASQLHHALDAAGTEAKRALLNARRDTKDAIAGARQGWDRSSGKGSGEVDINHAGRLTLLTLPGIGPKQAAAIVHGRPWSGTHQLETSGVLTPEQYRGVSGLITAH